MSASQKVLLLIDERGSGIEMLGRLLVEDGYRVEIVNDGARAALRLMTDPSPDLLVTNVSLPFVDGFTLAKVARSRMHDVGIVFITEHPHLLEHKRAGLSPEPLVLAKPVDYCVLSRELASLLRGTPEPVPMEDGDEHAA
jgi:DNA-binding response OmpR family regulator